jgi:glutathione synthase/RimK-type ligase-like ATP-grasp enzyme
VHVLIISTLDDAHIPFVTKHFPASVSYTIIDPFGAIGKDDVSYIFENDVARVYYGSQELGDIDSVWFRKPTHLDKVELAIPDSHRSYVQGALRRHLAPLYRHWKESLWVSPYEAIVDGENKPHQLEVAAKIGFTIPSTLITGDAIQARAFVEKHGTCVAKSQAVEFPRGKTLMTTVVTSESNLSYDGLSIDPMIFQQFIEPAYELRITVVGRAVFAAKIKSADQGPFRDWRYGHIDNSFAAEATTIDADLQEKCVQLTQQLGLRYGAIDLIVDKDGVVWFLEINPNGQWAFIEEATGQPIGKAMAELLCMQP